MLFDKNTEEKLQDFLEAKTKTVRFDLLFKKIGLVFETILVLVLIVLLISTIFNTHPGIVRFSNCLK